MASLTAVHITDIHEDVAMIEAATAIAEKEGADVTYITGDFVGRDHTSGKNIDNLEDVLDRNANNFKPTPEYIDTITEVLKKHGLKSIEEYQKINDKDDQNKLATAFEHHKDEVDAAFVKPVVDAYSKIKPYLSKLSDKTKIVGVLGNHDLTIGYKVLEGIVDFVETKNEVTIKGKSGKEFKIKGAINCNDVENVYKGNSALTPYLINYLQGNPDLSKEEVVKAQNEEISRLSETGETDIFLTHAQPFAEHDHGRAVDDYSSQAGSIYGGHYHGAEIKVVAGKPVFRPGTDHVFVYNYDDNKDVESVRIYKVA